jgi:AAA ATPase containing von Willebrand factor type A (vWA) domain
MSLLKTVAYLAFGLAALAIVFILFFIRDLDHRVGGVDSALNALEEKMAPLRKEVKDGFEQVNTDINGLETKIVDKERRAAVIELERALVAIQGMGLSDSPKVKAKSNEVTASIKALLAEFGAGATAADGGPTQVSAPEIKVEEAPLIELPTVEQVTEEHTTPVVKEHLEGSEVVAEEESLPLHEEPEEPEEPAVDEEPSSDEESDAGEDDEGEDDEGEDDEGEDDEGEDDEDEDDDE